MTDGESLAERRGLETNVYQPAEDSGLLADAAVEFARGRVLEVGTGSGWVAEQVAEKGNTERVVASDLNPHACRSARERGLEAVRGNLLAPFAEGSFETVLFNPPYLPTDPDNEWDDWMEHALSGGESGRRVIEPFLADVRRVLAPEGRALLLISTLTGVEAVRDRAREAGLTTRQVAEEAHPYEKLLVLRLDPI